MKFIPILFSTPMVKAIQVNRKTMTRRTKGLDQINECPDDWYFTNMTCTDGDSKEFFFKHKYYQGDGMDLLIPCPYGKVGDVLWVRESFYIGGKEGSTRFYLYKTDVEAEHVRKWKPSIHMPKSACRIFLKITDIKVERLKDISRGDAMQEGCPFPNIAKETNPVAWFASLWQSINGFKSWNDNPWVWVISFKRIDKPINF